MAIRAAGHAGNRHLPDALRLPHLSTTPLMSAEDWKQTHPLGSTWRFSWTEEYVVTISGHTRRGLKVIYKKPGTGHTLKRGIYQPEELVPEKK
jgi:hypothetical protein